MFQDVNQIIFIYAQDRTVNPEMEGVTYYCCASSKTRRECFGKEDNDSAKYVDRPGSGMRSTRRSSCIPCVDTRARIVSVMNRTFPPQALSILLSK